MTTFLDTFDRADTPGPAGLGSIPDGATWEYVSGLWRIAAGRAVTDTDRNVSPIAAVDVGPDGLFTLSVSPSGGDALYFRIVDAANWWRARVRRWQTVDVDTEYQWRRNYVSTAFSGTSGAHSHPNGNGSNGNYPGQGSANSLRWHSSSSSSPGTSAFPNSITHTHTIADSDGSLYSLSHTHSSGQAPFYTGNTRSDSSTQTNSYVYVERSVGGSVVTVATSVGATSQLAARITGNAISVFKSGSSTPFYSTTSSVHEGATRHGIGRGPSELSGSALDTFIAEVSNLPPNAPLLTSVGTIDRTVGARLRHTFSDPDTNDSQSGFDEQIRAVGTSTLDVDVSLETTAQHYDLPGGTLTAGDYERRVRTRDALGIVGPWSSWQQFTAADPTAGPTFTAPVDGATVSTELFTVEWSAAEQDDFELRRVASSFAAPDESTIYFTTNVVASSGARSYTVPFETNSRSEFVQLRVRRDGLWSLWTSILVHVSYTPPAQPQTFLEVRRDVVAGRERDVGIYVQAWHLAPTGAQPTVESVDVYRRNADEGGDGIRIATGLAPTAIFSDLTVASVTEYAYRHAAVGDNGTSSFGAWTGALGTVVENPPDLEPPDPDPDGPSSGSTLPATLPFALSS